MFTCILMKIGEHVPLGVHKKRSIGFEHRYGYRFEEIFIFTAYTAKSQGLLNTCRNFCLKKNKILRFHLFVSKIEYKYG